MRVLTFAAFGLAIGMLAVAVVAPPAAASFRPCSPDTGVTGGVLVGFGSTDIIVARQTVNVLPQPVYVPGTPAIPAVGTPTYDTPGVTAPGTPAVGVPAVPGVDRPATPALGVPGAGLGSAEIGSGSIVVTTPQVVVPGATVVPAQPGGNVVPARPAQTVLPAGHPTPLVAPQHIQGTTLVPGQPATPGHTEQVGAQQPTYVKTPTAWVYDVPVPCVGTQIGREPPGVQIGKLPDTLPTAGAAV